MNRQLQDHLKPIRQRQQWAAALHWAVRGLIVTCLMAIAIEALRRALGWWYSPMPGLLAVMLGPIVGAAAGLSHPIAWQRVAAAVDRAYQLKDRTTTALAFSRSDDQTGLRGLAIEDALARLATVDPRRVAPLGIPQSWRPAAVAAAAAIVITLWPGPQRQAQAIAAPPVPGFVDEAQQLQEQIEELQKLAEEQDDPTLKELSEKLIEQAEQMKQPGVELADALATLSQMQAELMQQQAQFNIAVTDAHLQSLGDAMATSESLSEIGKALQKGDYQNAAEQLDSLENLTPNSSTKRRLSQVAGAMANAGLAQLAKATSALSDAHSTGSNKNAGGRACKSLGRSLRTQAGRKRANRWMMSQLARLNQSKDACKSCAAGQCKSCNGGGCKSCNGSGRNGGSATSLSTKPSNSWGAGATGNPTGDPTQIEADRQREQLTGAMGDGPVDTEIIHSPEARQMAGREYRKTYKQYRKMNESVLESEPIPLGHRRTIQRYFESIRPSDGEADE